MSSFISLKYLSKIITLSWNQNFRFWNIISSCLQNHILNNLNICNIHTNINWFKYFPLELYIYMMNILTFYFSAWENPRLTPFLCPVLECEKAQWKFHFTFSIGLYIDKWIKMKCRWTVYSSITIIYNLYIENCNIFILAFNLTLLHLIFHFLCLLKQWRTRNKRISVKTFTPKQMHILPN